MHDSLVSSKCDPPRAVFARLVSATLCASALLLSAARVALAQEPRAKSELTEKLPGRIFVAKVALGFGRSPFAVNPNDQTWTLLPPIASQFTRISFDGRRMVHQAANRLRNGPILISDVDGENPPVSLMEANSAMSAFWLPDGKHVVVTDSLAPGDNQKFITWKISDDGSERTKLPIPETRAVIDVSADGQWFITVAVADASDPAGTDPNSPHSHYLIHPDGTGERLLIDATKLPKSQSRSGQYRFSPDGRTVLFVTLHEKERADSPDLLVLSLWLVGTDGKDARCIRKGTEVRFPTNACWSPDGKWLAVAMRQKQEDGDGRGGLRAGNGTVEIVDREGQTQRLLHLPQAAILTVLDWR